VKRTTLALAAVSALGLAAAFVLLRGGSNVDAELSTIPSGVPVPDPTTVIVSMDLSEDLSQEVTLELLELEKALAVADYEAAETFFSPGFRGTDPESLTPEDPEPGPMEALLLRYRVKEAPLVDRQRFLRGLEALFEPWATIEWLQLTLDRAEFQVGRPVWGKIRFSLDSVGTGSDGAKHTLELQAAAQVVQLRGRWILHALELTSAEGLTRPAPIFTEVSEAAGVHYVGPEFERGSQNWNGAASADVNGDGLWDVFLPSPRGNFLYVALPDGGYEDQAALRGVREPAGGTGVVFFDFDNDGDQDLLIGDEAYRDADGLLHGNPLRLYRNDWNAGSDSWSFVDVSEHAGVSVERYTYGIAIFDYDQDGFLDFFVSNYGRFRRDRPNSWIDADNAQPNQLFRNVAGKRFEDVSAKAGVEDPHWTFLAAAADYDRDGAIDLYQVNDFGENVLLKNDGDGTFSDVTGGEVLGDLGFGMSASWADLNNDGHLDLYVSNMYMPIAHRILARFSATGDDIDRMAKMAAGNTILLGRGGDRFERAPAEHGAVDCLWAWASVPLDVDLDGWLDLFCTNGFITRPEPGDALTYYWRNVIASSIGDDEPSVPVRREVADSQYLREMANFVWKERRSNSGNERDRLWFNVGDGRFLDASGISGADAPVDGRSVLVADFDDDGDPDLLVHGMQRKRHYLYRNDGQDPGNRFLKVQLRATRGQYEAIGAEVMVDGPNGQHSQVLSRQPPELVFGVGAAGSARVELLWPGGHREDFGVIPGGSSVLLVQGAGKPEYRSPAPRPMVRAD
jgi:hypothetical protein